MAEGRPKYLEKTTAWKRKETVAPEVKKERFVKRMRDFWGKLPGRARTRRRAPIRLRSKLGQPKHIHTPMPFFATQRTDFTRPSIVDPYRPGWARKRDLRRKKYPRGER